MKKIKNLPVLFMIIYQLIIGQTFIYASSLPSNTQRTNDNISNMMKNANPSDLPFIDYSDSFILEHTQPIKEHDLSDYIGKKVYIGYGLYDSESNYCKFVELASAPTTITTRFTNINTFNEHSYAISTEPNYTYDECKILAEDYGGYIATPTSAAENSFLSSYNVQNWLGVFRDSCAFDYFNLEGTKQEFTSWTMSQRNTACDSSQLKVAQLERNSWMKVGGLDTYRCIIEVNSPDINRPIKLCAPWWRIERKYTKPANFNINAGDNADWELMNMDVNNSKRLIYNPKAINIKSINKADVPELYNICTQWDASGVAAINNGAMQEFHCTTYYDATRKEECLRNVYQAQCKVSECQGYVENACTHIETVRPLKDYTKIWIERNGVPTEIRGKAKIRTQVYNCPVTTPGTEECLTKSTVIAYPKECPGSQCSARDTCYNNSVDSDGLRACDASYTCEKRYPNIQRTPAPTDLDADNNLIHMHATCSDGSDLVFDVNVQNRLNKTCLEYSEIEETTEITKNCLIEREFEDFTLDMSITASDEYEADPDCVRKNNILTARPPEDILISLKNNGYSVGRLTKVYLDGTDIDISVEGSSGYIQTFLDAQVATVPGDTGSISTTPGSNSIGGCPLNDSDTAEPPTQINAFYTLLKEEVAKQSIQIYTGSPSTKVTVENTLGHAQCDTFATSIGGSVVSYTPKCKVERSASTQDKIFQKIRKVGMTGGDDSEPIIEYTSSNLSYTALQCEDWAYCLSGTGALNASGRCVSTDHETFLTPAGPDPVNLDGDALSECTPGGSTIPDIPEVFNGIGELYVFADEIDGVFGYSSNYLNFPYQLNSININGKEMFPIVPTSEITDVLNYFGQIMQRAIQTKEPNYLAGAAGGAAAGAAYAIYAVAVVVPILIIVIVVVAIIVALFFGKKEKLNEASIAWIIYKDILKSEYITNVYGTPTKTYDPRMKYNLNATTWRMKYIIDGDDPTLPLGNNYKNFSGTFKQDKFQKQLDNMAKMKRQKMTCLGFPLTYTASYVHYDETHMNRSYPKCKWYKTKCESPKVNHTSDGPRPIRKQMVGYYAGATNGLSILVPFTGDYEVEAFDVNGLTLGKLTIFENEFMGETADTLSNAQVNFGLVMNIAGGLTDDARTGACREVFMTEWGGGVSGIYAENNDAGGVHRASCSKSKDNYVKDHSMTSIKIKPLNQDDWFTIRLEKPMPYANRVKLTTMSKKEIREYRCYFEFEECAEDDYTTVGGL